MKFSGKVGNGPMNKRLNFGGDVGPRIRIATQVRPALAEVWTAPVSIFFTVAVQVTIRRDTANGVEMSLFFTVAAVGHLGCFFVNFKVLFLYMKHEDVTFSKSTN